jgi:hypothetical protein
MNSRNKLAFVLALVAGLWASAWAGPSPANGARRTKIIAEDTGKVWRPAATTAIPAASISPASTAHINREMRSSAEDGELVTTRVSKAGNP